MKTQNLTLRSLIALMAIILWSAGSRASVFTGTYTVTGTKTAYSDTGYPFPTQSSFTMVINENDQLIEVGGYAMSKRVIEYNYCQGWVTGGNTWTLPINLTSMIESTIIGDKNLLMLGTGMEYVPDTDEAEKNIKITYDASTGKYSMSQFTIFKGGYEVFDYWDNLTVVKDSDVPREGNHPGDYDDGGNQGGGNDEYSKVFGGVYTISGTRTDFTSGTPKVTNETFTVTINAYNELVSMLGYNNLTDLLSSGYNKFSVKDNTYFLTNGAFQMAGQYVGGKPSEEFILLSGDNTSKYDSSTGFSLTDDNGSWSMTPFTIWSATSESGELNENSKYILLYEWTDLKVLNYIADVRSFSGTYSIKGTYTDYSVNPAVSTQKTFDMVINQYNELTDFAGFHNLTEALSMGYNQPKVTNTTYTITNAVLQLWGEMVDGVVDESWYYLSGPDTEYYEYNTGFLLRNEEDSWTISDFTIWKADGYTPHAPYLAGKWTDLTITSVKEGSIEDFTQNFNAIYSFTSDVTDYSKDSFGVMKSDVPFTMTVNKNNELVEIAGYFADGLTGTADKNVWRLNCDSNSELKDAEGTRYVLSGSGPYFFDNNSRITLTLNQDNTYTLSPFTIWKIDGAELEALAYYTSIKFKSAQSLDDATQLEIGIDDVNAVSTGSTISVIIEYTEINVPKNAVIMADFTDSGNTLNRSVQLDTNPATVEFTDVPDGEYSFKVMLRVVIDGETITTSEIIDFKVTVNNGNGDDTGIGTIESDGSKPRFFNLQGVEVANPETGVYIEVKGGKARKLRF